MKEKTLIHLFFASAVLYLALLNHITFPLTTILKPLPIMILMWWARLYMPNNIKWVFLFWALVLSACGDIALTFSGLESFIAGLSLFLFAHVLYIFLFFSRPVFHWLSVSVITLIVIFSYSMFQLLSPHLHELYIPVVLYLCVIVTMVSVALLGKNISQLSRVGVIFFLSSDSLLAIMLFLPHTLPLKHAVMVTYYLAQFMILKGMLPEQKTVHSAY